MKAKMMAMMLLGRETCQLLLLFLLDWRQRNENSHEVWEHNHILELASQPNQVERVLVDADLLS